MSGSYFPTLSEELCQDDPHVQEGTSLSLKSLTHVMWASGGHVGPQGPPTGLSLSLAALTLARGHKASARCRYVDQEGCANSLVRPDKCLKILLLCVGRTIHHPLRGQHSDSESPILAINAWT